MQCLQIRYYLLLSLILLIPVPVLGWSGGGHMIVAHLAFSQLSPAQQDRAIHILEHLPAFDHDIGRATRHMSGQQRKIRIFMLASVWPDLIKNEKHPAHSESRPAWHVAWLPIAQPGYTVPAKPPKSGKMDTMDALPLVMRDFATSNALPLDRQAVNLAWILHLVGDLHQPLHSGAFYSSQWPAGDQSGSLFHLKPSRKQDATPLHKVWDGLFGGRDTPTTDILKMAASIASDPALNAERLRSELAVSVPQDWIRESREVARTKAYLLETSAPLQGLPTRQLKKAVATGGDIPVLPDGYIRRAKVIARRRIAIAAYRLGSYLNKTL